MDTVIIRAKRGFLANTTEKLHRAFKTTPKGGDVFYEVHYAGSRVFLPADMVEEIAPIETYWFVKSETRATEQNTNCAGQVHTHIYGTGGETLFAQTGEPLLDRDHMTPYFILNYGYKRYSDAKRSYAYKNPERSVYWQERVQIVSVDIQKDENGVYHVV